MRIDPIKFVEALRIVLVFTGFYCAYAAEASTLAVVGGITFKRADCNGKSFICKRKCTC